MGHAGVRTNSCWWRLETHSNYFQKVWAPPYPGSFFHPPEVPPVSWLKGHPSPRSGWLGKRSFERAKGGAWSPRKTRQHRGVPFPPNRRRILSSHPSQTATCPRTGEAVYWPLRAWSHLVPGTSCAANHPPRPRAASPHPPTSPPNPLLPGFSSLLSLCC